MARMNVSPLMTTAAVQSPLVWSLETPAKQQGAKILKNAVRIRSKSFAFRSPHTSGSRRFAIVVSRSTKEEANSKADEPVSLSFTSQDDLNFLLKLGAGSFASAAAIKYGSILVPEITRPNIIQALVMISTPVIVAVIILIKESYVKP